MTHGENVRKIMEFLSEPKNATNAYTYAEIAHETGIKKQTVRAIIRQNRERVVRKTIEGHAYVMWKKA